MKHLGLMCLMPSILLPTLTVKVKGNKLWCSATYISIDSYCQESESLLDHNFHLDFLEEIPNFSVLQRSPHISASSPLQNYLAIEKPNLTLDCVVDGMQKKKNKEDYHNNEDMGNHYMSKICMVLRLIANTVQYLYDKGFIHCDICLKVFGKFDDK